MTRRTSIGGVLDMAALGALTGITPLNDRRDYAREVRRMKAAGMTERRIASALSLSIGLVRELMLEPLPVIGRESA